jgi:hypothetical protein
MKEKKTYVFSGFLMSPILRNGVSVDEKRINAYSRKQAIFLLSKELSEDSRLKMYKQDRTYYYRVINNNLRVRTIRMREDKSHG